MNERIERLDRSMDFVLVLLSILSAAIFQYVTALPYDSTKEAEVTTFIFFMRFSFKLLFLPFLPLILMWLVMHVTRNENWRMLLRTKVWDFATTTMALNVIVMIVLVFPQKIEVFKYPAAITALAIVLGVFGLFFVFDVIVAKAYVGAMMMDARAPAHEFFFEKRWKYAHQLATFIMSLIWLVILWVSTMN